MEILAVDSGGRAAASSNRPPAPQFNLLELVKVAVLMADSLGYEVVPPKQAMTLEEVAALLPPAAQTNFSKQIDVLPERIAGRDPVIRDYELQV